MNSEQEKVFTVVLIIGFFGCLVSIPTSIYYYFKELKEFGKSVEVIDLLILNIIFMLGLLFTSSFLRFLKVYPWSKK